MVPSGLLRGRWRRSDGPLEGDTRPKTGRNGRAPARRNSPLLEAEVGELPPPLWSSRENDLSPPCCHDAIYFLSEM